MKKVIGGVSFNVWVECPSCEEDFDACDQDEEGYMSVEVFNNRWDGIDMELICPNCNAPLIMEKVEY